MCVCERERELEKGGKERKRRGGRERKGESERKSKKNIEVI